MTQAYRVPVEVKQAIRAKYAWPGGYPLYIIMSDCEALCIDCARKEYKLLAQAARDHDNSGWRPVAADVNWECTDLYCAHCSKQIESAYGDDEGQS